MSVAIQTASSLFVSTCNAQRRPATCVVWNSSLLRCSSCSAPNASVARKYFLLFHATGVSVSPHRVFDSCFSVDVSKDVVVSFSGSSEFIPLALFGSEAETFTSSLLLSFAGGDTDSLVDRVIMMPLELLCSMASRPLSRSR